jgi:signal transduction histidine kinase/DNA-binding response OmpR family regulator/streptogramin lyase
VQYRGCYDRNNLLWLYSVDGVWVYDLKSRRINEPLTALASQLAIVGDITQDADGNIWIGQHRNGVAIINPLTGTMKHISRASQLDNYTISALYTDSDGSVWIGTYKKGLYQYNADMYKFRMHDLPDVNCIANAGQSKVWIGTDSGQLIRWDCNTRESDLSVGIMDGDRARAIACLCPEVGGGVWIGTYRGGLKYYNSGSVRSFTVGTTPATRNIWAIVPADNGRLWLGTLGGGVLLYNPATGESTAYTVQNAGMRSDYVNSMVISHDGKLYVGTNSGLSVMNVATKQVYKAVDSMSGLDGLASANITQVYEDSRNLMWFATDEGLYMYDTAHNQLKKINLNARTQTPYIFGVVEDIQGSIWVSIGSELMKVGVIQDGGEYKFNSRLYTHRDGLQNSDFNQRSFCSLPSGEVFVGGMYGVNTFDPRNIPCDTKRPRVMFTDLKLFNNSVEVGQRYDGVIILSESLSVAEEICFNYSQNEFTICFATDDYVVQENTTYYYRLLGFNNEWMKCAGNMPQVTYTNLPSGTYTLEIKAVNNDGIESEETAKLHIVVYPPFWLSWWAKAFYILLVVIAIYYMAKVIKKRERKRYIEQKKEEAIQQQEELNRLKFKFFANISHELRTPLTLILSPIEAMQKNATDEKQKHRLEIVHNNATKLLNLVNQLLDFRKNEVAELKYLPIKGDIVSFIKGQCDAFNAYSEEKNVSLTFFSNAKSMPMYFDADKMGKIVMNLLSNAFKFTPDGGRVDVAINITDNKAIIKVADTGIGISDADKERIFDRFYQTDTSNSAGSGIGLSLVKEYVKLHDGSVEVVDNAGGGSVFIVTIPIRTSMPESAKEDAPKADKAAAEVPATEAAATDKAANDKSANGKSATNKAEAAADAPQEHNRPLVLVVDDNPDLLTFINEELSAQYRVETATNGKEALAMLDSHVPDIVVTDLMMPEVDGIELCRRMKSNAEWSGIPIIVLTAKQDEQAKVEGLTIGADDYITKPFNCDILKLRINKLLTLVRKGGRRSLIEPEPSHVQITSVDEKLIEQAVKYVEANMSSPDLSVEEMSKHLGMSRVHLYKRIRQVTGLTPIEFIRIMRLKRAAQLLRESQRNVSEIAYEVGFNNPKYFSKYFKDEFGVLPSVYQENEGK